MKLNLSWLLILSCNRLSALRHLAVNRLRKNADPFFERTNANFVVDSALHNSVGWSSGGTAGNKHHMHHVNRNDSTILQQSSDAGQILSNLNIYLSKGGRIKQVPLMAKSIGNSNGMPTLQTMGLTFNAFTAEYNCHNVSQLVSYCTARLQQQISIEERHNLFNILGRLAHGELNDPDQAITHYTAALAFAPNSSATFRNMGAAYHATGNLQLAFASYQQAIQLDPSDAMVYLKLGYLYEDLAANDWADAECHAVQCYKYYLEQADQDDISVLSRLAHLLTEYNPVDAIPVYEKINYVDASCLSGWYNKAVAQMKIGDFAGAQACYERCLQLDATLPVAKHMLAALTGTTRACMDPVFITSHFDAIAATYDKRMKQLQYAAPRVIRLELSKIYKSRFLSDTSQVPSTVQGSASEPEITGVSPTSMNPKIKNDCHPSERSFMRGALSVLDLGCGTGLAGAWLREYAHHLTGVDVSQAMMRVAENKHLYDELHTALLQDYLTSCCKADGNCQAYDLIVAAGVLGYVGDLDELLPQAVKLLRPQGLFAFTFEPMLGTGGDNDQIRRQNPPYQLQRTGQLAYSEDYILQLVRRLAPEFSLAGNKSFNMVANGNVPGRLIIVQKH